MLRRIIAGIFMLCIFSTAAFAFPPVFVLGGYGGGSFYGSGGSLSFYPSISGSGLSSYRTALGGGGYFAVNLSGIVRYYFYPVLDFQDNETASLMFGLPIGANTLELEAGISSSFNNLGPAGLYLEPDWRLAFLLDEIGEDLGLRFEYIGYYRYERDSSGDRLSQSLVSELSYDPSVRIGADFSLSGGLELWPEFFLYGAGGSLTEDTRRDFLLGAGASIEGLLGFFTSWDLDSKLSLRLSNANRYLTVPGELEENSENRLTTSINASLGLSPVQQVGIQLGVDLENQYYLARAALAEDDSKLGSNLNVFLIGGSLRADYTPDNALYFVLEFDGSYSFSADPNFNNWNANIQGGIEYSF